MIYSFLILFFILLSAAIAWNIFASQRHENTRKKNKRLAALGKVLKNTEELIADTGGVPMSQSLLIILYRRMGRILKEMYIVDATAQIQTQFESVQAQLKQTTDTPLPKPSLIIPGDDFQCGHIIKCSKLITNIVRIEFANGSISSQLYNAEMQRLRALQLSIYGETALRKAQLEIDSGRLENARTLLTRYTDGMNSTVYKDSPNLKFYLDKFNGLMAQLDEHRQQAHKQKQKAEAERAEEIAQLLGHGERKKWN